LIDCLLEFLAHPLVTLFVGAGVTWFAAWFYYKKAGDELRIEAKRLHQTNSMILYFLENPGHTIEVQRGSDGRATGLIVKAVGHAAGSSSASGVGSQDQKHP
jgi:hypothetical protein